MKTILKALLSAPNEQKSSISACDLARIYAGRGAGLAIQNIEQATSGHSAIINNLKKENFTAFFDDVTPVMFIQAFKEIKSDVDSVIDY